MGKEIKAMEVGGKRLGRDGADLGWGERGQVEASKNFLSSNSVNFFTHCLVGQKKIILCFRCMLQ